MEKENNLWRNVIIVSIVVAVVVAVLAGLIRTEKRFHRLIGILRSHLPQKRQNREFRIELEDI